MGISPVIGNVFSGFDIEAIKKVYIDDYENKSISECNNCWAYKLCRVCYAKIFSDKSLDTNKKRIMCEETRYYAYKELQQYHALLEDESPIIEYLSSIN